MTKYVDVDRGLISREIFVDETIYREELERVFCNSWLFVGLASQVPNPGDFVTSRMGEESVIMTRDRAGQIHVLLNSCRHRGMKVCRYDVGNTPVFTCSYHAWSYGLNGDLIGVPRMKDAYYGELNKSAFGLLKARTTNYRGTIWATWNQDGPDFAEYLGDMSVFLNAALDPTDGIAGELETLPGVQKSVLPCNWKFAAENFAGDLYHSAPSHISVEAIGIGPGGRGQTRHGNPFKRHSTTSFPASGHAFRGAPSHKSGYPFPGFADETVEKYYRDAWRRRTEKYPDEEMPSWTWGGGGLVFPNTCFHTRFPWSIMVAHPAGPMKTEMWRWYLVEKSMPEEVKAYLRRYLLRYSGPGGMTEQDDMENWNLATAASAGAMARRLPYNLQQGLGHWTDSDDPIKGARYSESAVSEANALSFYGHWAKMMESPVQAAGAPEDQAMGARR